MDFVNTLVSVVTIALVGAGIQYGYTVLSAINSTYIANFNTVNNNVIAGSSLIKELKAVVDDMKALTTKLNESNNIIVSHLNDRQKARNAKYASRENNIAP